MPNGRAPGCTPGGWLQHSDANPLRGMARPPWAPSRTQFHHPTQRTLHAIFELKVAGSNPALERELGGSSADRASVRKTRLAVRSLGWPDFAAWNGRGLSSTLAKPLQPAAGPRIVGPTLQPTSSRPIAEALHATRCGFESRRPSCGRGQMVKASVFDTDKKSRGFSTRTRHVFFTRPIARAIHATQTMLVRVQPRALFALVA